MRALLMACLWWLAQACLAETVTLSSADYPPYFGPRLPHEGIVTAIAAEAFRRAGDRLVIRYRVWAQSLDEAGSGATDGIVGLWHSAERERNFAYSQSLYANQIGFYARKERRFDTRDLALLKRQGVRVGVVRGYLNPARFEAARLPTDISADDEENLRKLALGRYELALIDRGVAAYLLHTRLASLRDSLMWLEPGVESMPLYIGFSRRSAGWQRRLAHFNAGLAALRQDGTLERLERELGYR
jgi:polar amino acid transport system substrate-binding protein